MNRDTLALIIEQGTQILSTVIRNKDILFAPSHGELQEDESPHDEPMVVTQSHTQKATAIATGCIPCSLGHLGTCSGLLNEAMRFARNDGIQSEEVIDRVNICMDELAALIRVDLRPEMIVHLASKEKSLANEILVNSRDISHKLEGLSKVADLEEIAAETQTLRRRIGKEWFRERLTKMSPDQIKELVSQTEASEERTNPNEKLG